MISTDFLDQVAAYLHRNHAETLHRCCIVFPNKRSPLYFNRYLSKYIDRPVWAPSFQSIDTLMSDISGLQTADSLQLQAELYRAYRQVTRTDVPFDRFYHLGELILHDFDETDKYLVPVQHLFRNAAELLQLDRDLSYLSDQQIEAIRQFWEEFGQPDDLPWLKQRFAELWSHLAELYTTFQEILLGRKAGYTGMIYRTAVSRMEAQDEPSFPFDRYLFVGFNALTPCEIELFDHLQRSGKALFFWDYDTYYTQDGVAGPLHEAGRALRSCISRYPAPPDFEAPEDPHMPSLSHRMLTTPKDMAAIGIPSGTGQARLAGTLLQELVRTGISDWNRTAVVLPDEQLLTPMLSCLPREIPTINVTMGYAFALTPAFSLTDKLFQLQQTAVVRDGVPAFHHAAVQEVLMHPYIRLFAPKTGHTVEQQSLKANRTYLTADELMPSPDDPDAKSVSRLLTLIFDTPRDKNTYSAYLIRILRHIGTALQQADRDAGTSDYIYPVEYLYTACTTLQRVHDVLQADDLEMDWMPFARLFRQHCRSVRIPFSGEPLHGLQIMGMLETRTLDFDHVIILSANEGHLPPNRPLESLIPYQLRKPFGLPESEHQDALQAYYLYRLMQRARYVRFIYQTGQEQTGEVSRFVTQLKYEPAFCLKEQQVGFSIAAHEPAVIVKPRSESVAAALEQYTKAQEPKFLSPSAIRRYLHCPLSFYFYDILKIREKDQFIEDIDSRVFGNILHKTMKLLYTGATGTPRLPAGLSSRYAYLPPDDLMTLQKDSRRISASLDQAMQEEFFRSDAGASAAANANVVIIREQLLRYIRKMIEVDARLGGFTPILMEEPVYQMIDIHPEGGPPFRVAVGGLIDRMDWDGRQLRIIDYKTGTDKMSFKSCEALFEKDKDTCDAIRQTLIYAEVIARHPQYGAFPVSANLFKLRNLYQTPFECLFRQDQKPVALYQEIRQEFEPLLKALLTELFCSDQPFGQTDNRKLCGFCPYCNICRRPPQQPLRHTFSSVRP